MRLGHWFAWRWLSAVVGRVAWSSPWVVVSVVSAVVLLGLAASGARRRWRSWR